VVHDERDLLRVKDGVDTHALDRLDGQRRAVLAHYEINVGYDDVAAWASVPEWAEKIFSAMVLPGNSDQPPWAWFVSYGALDARVAGLVRDELAEQLDEFLVEKRALQLDCLRADVREQRGRMLAGEGNAVLGTSSPACAAECLPTTICRSRPPRRAEDPRVCGFLMLPAWMHLVGDIAPTTGYAGTVRPAAVITYRRPR
jgi:hypothetical protein